jgi:hypothetical protein
MSGGAFDYIQYRIDDIINRIEQEIHDATKPRPATQTVKYTPVYEMITASGSVRLEYHPINHCKDLDEVRKVIKKNKIKVIEDKGDKIIFEENGMTRYTYVVQYEEYPEEYDEDGYKVYPFVFGPMSPFTVGVDLSRVSPEAKRLINSWFPVPLYCDNVS